MKFAYQDLKTQTIGGFRVYTTPNGDLYPSITSVLGGSLSVEKKEGLKKWQLSLGASKAQQVLEEAGRSGTAVHLLAERFLKGEQLIQPGDNIQDKDIRQFNALKLKLKKIGEIWCQEQALYSDELGIAGRTDLIGVYDKVPSVTDYKTSMIIKGEERIHDYKLQLCAYAMMHNEMFGTDLDQGVIIMTSAGGFPQVFIVRELNKYKGELIDRCYKFSLQ